MLKLAEAGELKLFCVYCGVPWEPPPDEQRMIAENIRKHIASQSA
jgi:hypothetical protein